MAPIKWVAHDTDIECSKPEKFGMYHGQPCLMIKLNKVYGWEPEPYYNITEVSVKKSPHGHGWIFFLEILIFHLPYYT